MQVTHRVNLHDGVAELVRGLEGLRRRRRRRRAGASARGDAARRRGGRDGREAHLVVGGADQVLAPRVWDVPCAATMVRGGGFRRRGGGDLGMSSTRSPCPCWRSARAPSTALRVPRTAGSRRSRRLSSACRFTVSGKETWMYCWVRTCLLFA